ncbi:MAG: putative toxin-antitoxin system toxin component, PIN family [Anaerolineaceae bacterium]|nr:putative toxin-antitoxin system toxin component, PIN family [Anaerolineaceae bacterium]MCB9100737.1 putative toxin-antitoxin system toxin component, PIN family [Anaerolineales bacterium]
MLRIVLDTNQLVKALMRPPELATFMMAWDSKRFTVLCSPELLKEYQLVLNYPEIANLIYPELLRAFQSHLIHDFEIIDLPQIPQLCRDPDDDKVIATALYGRADYLLTEDQDLKTDVLIKLFGETGIQIATMDRFIRILDKI